MTLNVIDRGHMAYADAWALQRELADARRRGSIPDTLLFVEHPHVYTLGTGAHDSNLLWDEAERCAHGVTVVRVDRGGDVTYHGPGQLVGYPIIQLPRTVGGLHADVIGYVRTLERVIIDAIADFGLIGTTIPGLTGVWVDREGTQAKIAAIGVKVTAHAVTQHGFALNIDPDMRYFGGIIPCGIADKPVTSMAELLPIIPTRAAVIDSIVAAFARNFSESGPPPVSPP